MGTRWPDISEAGLVESLVRSVLASADPGIAAESFLRKVPGTLFKHERLLAIGKAAVPMARAVVDACGMKIRSGLVLTTPGASHQSFPDRIEVLTADHPLPTERNVEAANRVRDFVSSLTGKDRLLAMISGGGSALLTLPASGILLADLSRLSGALMRAGCPIDALNTVRKHCEQLKGGRLGAMCRAHSVVACVISDVIGDSLSTIASGPFAPDPTTSEDAIGVLDRFGCADVAPAITAHLREGSRGGHDETPKPGDLAFDRIFHTISLGNRDAVNAAIKALTQAGFEPSELDPHTGEAREAARLLVAGLKDRGAAVMGGEPVVGGIGSGVSGGPVQEAVLAAALLLEDDPSDWLVMGFATDGRDGPTDAAGAALDRRLLQKARSNGLDLDASLARHDVYPVLREMDALIRTGPTGTNVNDVLVALRR